MPGVTKLGALWLIRLFQVNELVQVGLDVVVRPAVTLLLDLLCATVEQRLFNVIKRGLEGLARLTVFGAKRLDICLRVVGA